MAVVCHGFFSFASTRLIYNQVVTLLMPAVCSHHTGLAFALNRTTMCAFIIYVRLPGAGYDRQMKSRIETCSLRRAASESMAFRF